MRTMQAMTSPLLLLAVLTGIGAAPAAAQNPQRGEARGQRAVQRTLANALDEFAILQARRTLQLNEAQYEEFLPRLRALQQTRRRHQQARNRIVQELRQLAGPRAAGTPDDAAIAQALAALREHDDRVGRELRAAYDALDEVLEPQQRARFRLFEEALEARKLDLLMRARARAGRGGGF